MTGAFGTNTTAAPAFGSTSLTFGTATNQPQSTGFTFGTPAAAGGGGGLFGTPASTSTTTAPLFGASTGSTGLFGATPAVASVAPTLSFGPSVPTAPATGTGLSFGTPAASTGLNFGFGSAVTSTGTATSTTTTTGLNFGFGSNSSGAPTSSIPTLNFTPAPTTTATAGPLGLSAILPSSQATGLEATAQKEVAPKDQQLPNEILQTVDAFKNMVKQQKSYSSDISRCSIKDFRRVEEGVDQLIQRLKQAEHQVKQHRQRAEKLKHSTAKMVQDVEMAQRTHDTPPGLQYDNTAPFEFFVKLVRQFEEEMESLKQRIDAADHYIKNHRNPDYLTPEDLVIGMKKIHETFISVASRLHSIHLQVEAKKEEYLSMRPALLNDSVDPFGNVIKPRGFYMSNQHSNSPKVATGPTPFNNLAFRAVNLGLPKQPTTQPPAYPGSSSGGATGFGSAFGTAQPANTSLFGSSLTSSPFGSSLQLQKPPTGNKRGKM